MARYIVRHIVRQITHFSVLVVLAALASWPVHASEHELDADALLDMPLDRLTDIVVTSVSKREQPVEQAAAAIFVLTQDDIHRSGATRIPEVLRMVPGLHVARSGSNQWAISSRGFTDQFSNKLLVLIDGRTVYNPLFSGVWWDTQDVVMEDIERIEVIRGPGAALWGANAVNGVINIITKQAKDTHGTLISAGAGNQERGFITARHGAELENNAHLRVYSKAFSHDGMESANAIDQDADWRGGQAGFRLDWALPDGNEYSIQGDIYNQSTDNTLIIPTLTPPYGTPYNDVENMTGGNLMGHWNKQTSDTTNSSLQLYISREARRVAILDQQLTTMDIEFQRGWDPEGRHNIVWGAGSRWVNDRLEGSDYLSFTPEKRSVMLHSAFIQDEITLLPDTLLWTVGSKLEWNSFSHFEVQPSTRLAWHPNDNHTVWGALSRAVRTPNRATDDISFLIDVVPGPTPAFVRLEGNRALIPESLLAYELGYRYHPSSALSFDIALFYNDYNDIASNRPGAPIITPDGPLPLQPVIPSPATNGIIGETYGAELTADWHVTPAWRLVGSYSLLEIDLDTTDASLLTNEGRAPKHMLTLRSHLDITPHWQLDTIGYYVDDLTGPVIDEYVRLDTRIAWLPHSGLEVSLVGQNLLDDGHQEFQPFIYNNPSDIGRSIYGTLTVRF